MKDIEEIKEKLNDYRIVIVSNREPYEHHLSEHGLEVRETVGGLTSALNPAMKEINSGLWIASGSSEEDFKVVDEKGRTRVPNNQGYLLKRVKLTPEEIKHFYEGFANNILWPNAHLFSDKCIFSEKDWEIYKKVNQKFASNIVDETEEKDLIWVHDYHFALVPKYVKYLKPNSKIAFFWHIPFPPYEIFNHLCTHWGAEIIEGLLSCDMIGFHTKDYAENFIKTAEKIIGAKRHEDGLRFKGRLIKVKNFPISIDYDKFNVKPSIEEIIRKKQEQSLTDKIIIFGVDRLDYTKGILERLWAFKNFLEKNEEMRDKVIFIQITSPSRTNVEEYQELKKQIDETVGEINSKFRDMKTGLEPVRCYYKSFTPEELIFYYNIADIALITPLADGMNMVAKEFIAASDNGILILSDCTGASEQLKEALIVNSRDIPEVARAIETGIKMPRHERIIRLNALKERVKHEDVWWWINSFLDEWIEIYQ